jgi:hypothetical protein
MKRLAGMVLTGAGIWLGGALLSQEQSIQRVGGGGGGGGGAITGLDGTAWTAALTNGAVTWRPAREASFLLATNIVSFGLNYIGYPDNYFGCRLTVGPEPVVVDALGRYIQPGNRLNHTVRLVATNGTVLGAVVVTTNVTDRFVYTALAEPVALLPNTSYYLVSYESNGGDYAYHMNSTVLQTDAPMSIACAAYVNGGSYVDVADSANKCYGPLNLSYRKAVRAHGEFAGVSVKSWAGSGALAFGENVYVSSNGVPHVIWRDWAGYHTNRLVP